MINKKEIEDKLVVLIGLPLARMMRAANTEMFSFGNDRMITDHKGNLKRVGEFELHVQCAWRITGTSGIVVGSSDIYSPSSRYHNRPADFVWDRPGANRCDEQVKRFFESKSKTFIVRRIEVDRVGGLKIEMQPDFYLEMFPDSSLTEEQWRFFEPGTGKPHFVIKSDDRENSEDMF